MSTQLLEAALVRLLTAHFRRGLEPSEVIAVKRIQKLLGREVIRFVQALIDRDLSFKPDDVADFRRRVHAAVKAAP